MVEAYEMMWQQVTQDGSLPYIVPISPGWDSRPWYGPHALVRTSPSSAKFLEMCERAKRYVNPQLNMVIAECWNEFGEGSFVEPTEEFGFGALDALRQAFCRPGDWPEDVVPSAEDKRTWTYDAIPADPLHRSPDVGAGNLLAWGDMDDARGWIGFDYSEPRFSTEAPHAGARCLELPPGKGVKSTAHVGLAFGREYEAAAWVRCAPGASVLVTSALFGRDGRWLGTYHDIGRSTAGEWTRIAKRVPGIDPGIGAIDTEFVADGGVCYVDGASISVAGDAPTEVALTDPCTSPDGWVLYDGSAAKVTDGALAIPPGTGVKTRHTIPAGPDVTYAVRAEIKCDEMATLEFRSALFDDRGGWLHTYAPVPMNSVSWQDWIDVTLILAFPPDTSAKACDVEFIALGDEGFVRNVRVVRGGRLERR